MFSSDGSAHDPGDSGDNRGTSIGGSVSNAQREAQLKDMEAARAKEIAQQKELMRAEEEQRMLKQRELMRAEELVAQRLHRRERARSTVYWTVSVIAFGALLIMALRSARQVSFISHSDETFPGVDAGSY